MSFNIDWESLILIFVLAAEQYITGTKKGAERKEWVIDQFYSRLPDILTKLVTKDMLSDLIEKAVTTMKEQLMAKANETE